MSKRLYLGFAGPLGAILAAAPLFGQVPVKSSPAAASSTAVEHAIDLAGKGRCQEALPALKKSLTQASDKQLEYRAAMATARCAMSLNQGQTAVNALFILKRDFPNDPEALYITTHYLSELASRASQELAAVAPGSYQAHELQAEALESQEKWDEAVAEYNGILAQNPGVPGIHFRLGRIAMSRPGTTTAVDEAKKEFEQELKIDPNNAAAEFSLGEIARRAGNWDEAIPHFTQASKIDPGFAEAFLALGMTLNSAQRFSEAVGALERYVKMLPLDPAGHYQLSIAYARTDRKQEAAREMAIQREISEKSARPSPDGALPR